MGRVHLDLHVHCRYSPDSTLSLETIAARLEGTGLNGFALTDHNTVAGHLELAELRSRFPANLFVPGVEVSSAEGHILAYGLSEVPPVHRSATETIEWIHSRGGVAVLAHPFRLSHGVGRAVSESAAVSAIETVNGHNSIGANRRAAEMAARRHLGTTGGSDVHELADLGRSYTEFPGETNSVESALRAIRAGATTAGGGSLAFGGRARLALRTTLLRMRRGFRSI